VLALAAMRAEYPDERRALLEIRMKEEELRSTAHRLLAEVWRISIGIPGGRTDLVKDRLIQAS
jgi:hypothetical protein